MGARNLRNSGYMSSDKVFSLLLHGGDFFCAAALPTVGALAFWIEGALSCLAGHPSLLLLSRLLCKVHFVAVCFFGAFDVIAAHITVHDRVLCSVRHLDFKVTPARQREPGSPWDICCFLPPVLSLL